MNRCFLCYCSYVLDGFPMTMKQAELMQDNSIIPMMVVEMEMDTLEVLKRGLALKMEENKSEYRILRLTTKQQMALTHISCRPPFFFSL